MLNGSIEMLRITEPQNPKKVCVCVLTIVVI